MIVLRVGIQLKPPLLQMYILPSGPSAAPLGPPGISATTSLRPSGQTRVNRRPRISTRTTDPSGITTGPSGNSRPVASTRILDMKSSRFSSTGFLWAQADFGVDPARAVSGHVKQVILACQAIGPCCNARRRCGASTHIAVVMVRDDAPRLLTIRAMFFDQTQSRGFAAWCARILLRHSRREKEKAQGNAGCPLHPQPVCKVVVAHGSHHRFTGHPAFPARWF